MEVNVFKPPRFGIAGGVFLGRAELAVDRSDRKLQHRSELRELIRGELVKRYRVTSKSNDQPSEEFARICMLDLPVRSNMDRWARRDTRRPGQSQARDAFSRHWNFRSLIQTSMVAPDPTACQVTEPYSGYAHAGSLCCFPGRRVQ